MTTDELIQTLNRGCTGGLTAIRCITKLQPAGGVGDKLFPPTYDKGTYAWETGNWMGRRCRRSCWTAYRVKRTGSKNCCSMRSVLDGSRCRFSR